MKKKSKKIKTDKKGKALSLFSGLSGTLGFLGGWQICHNLCLGIIAALSLIGITVVGMPLLFLTQYALYFWSIAVLLLIPTLIMYWKNRKYMSTNLILINIGVIIAGVPFLSTYQFIFWLVGGILIAGALCIFVRSKIRKM